MIWEHADEIDNIINRLDSSVDKAINEDQNLEIILKYIQICPDSRFEELLSEAINELDALPHLEQAHFIHSINSLILDAQEKKEKKEGAAGALEDIMSAAGDKSGSEDDVVYTELFDMINNRN